MYKFILVCALIGFVAAANDESGAVIISLENEVEADGRYKHSFETSNNIHAAAVGDENGNVRGNFGYISPEGEQVETTYVADEGGFQPEGAHLPVAPPIPDAILRSLAWNAAHPTSE